MEKFKEEWKKKSKQIGLRLDVAFAHEMAWNGQQ